MGPSTSHSVADERGSGQLGARVEQFIDRYVRSVAELDVLLLLARFGPLPRRDVARRLAFEPAMLDQSLKGLVRHALVDDHEGHLGIAGGDTAVAEVLEELAAVYRSRRIAVVARVIREREDGP